MFLERQGIWGWGQIHIGERLLSSDALHHKHEFEGSN